MSELRDDANNREIASTVEPNDVRARSRGNPLRRLGCGLLLVLWFMLLLTPCALFYLAANGEIRLWHTDIPEPHAHPMLLISLVSEMDDRGLRLESSIVTRNDASTMATCVETNVRFLLWQSRSNNQDVDYCDCYERENETGAWALDSTFAGNC